MRIAFYAPLKPPNHPIPSGDRRMARLLIKALRRAGHGVSVASRLRSYDGQGRARQQDIIRRRAKRVVRSYLARPEYSQRGDALRPDLWFTYHLYHKAPDLLGPAIARALSIPYVVAEASFAPKQANGPWRKSHGEVGDALRQAAKIIVLNPDDAACVSAHIKDESRLAPLAPFIDTGPARAAAKNRDAHRDALAKKHNLDPTKPWLATVAMMRPGDKFASYQALARIVGLLKDEPFHLLIAGDGPARAAIVGEFKNDSRLHWLGAASPHEVDALNATADLVVWPAIREAYGMAMLEAQAAGTPVVAGGAPGVRQIVAHGETGLIAPMDPATLEGDMAQNIRALLRDTQRRNAMGAAALIRTRSHHDIDAAAQHINQIIMEAA
jgi:glycosyltransferase involved in cell wall biosynthesis